jgi:hypothetical protein
MKTLPTTSSGHQRGSALIMLLGLIAMLLVVSAANNHSVTWLRRELRLVEQQQTKRLNAFATNSPAALRP